MKKKLGLLGALTALATMGAPSMAAPTVNATTHEVREGIADVKKAPRPVMQVRNAFGGFGNVSHKASRHLNQRQYRKLVRQNPHLRKSRKHRSKN